MADLKTKKTGLDVDKFLESVDIKRRADSARVAQIMSEITGEGAAIWGTNLVGFGQYHYVYESGREGDWFVTGFSPRKSNLTVYIMSGFAEYDGILARLGKFKTGKSCLYINKLGDIDEEVLRELIVASVEHIRATYP